MIQLLSKMGSYRLGVITVLFIILSGCAAPSSTTFASAVRFQNNPLKLSDQGQNRADQAGSGQAPEPLDENPEWPQLQHDPQRTGFSPVNIKAPYRLAWYRNFQPERVGRDVQAIACSGKVFVPTQSGNLYALDASNGEQRWVFPVGSPVMHTAACARDKVIVAALDGSVAAVFKDTGQQAWRFQSEGHTGFTVAPLIAGDKVFLGERSGIFYALNIADGRKAWSFDAGAPIFNSAAFNQGRVYFCDESMYVHALDAGSGSEIWRSEQLFGQSCKQYHPVIYQGFVIIRPMMTHLTDLYNGFAPFDRNWDSGQYNARIQQYSNFLYQGGPIPQELLDAQNNLIQYYKDHPFEQNLFILRESDGKQAFIPPQFQNMTLPGPPPPPVVDGVHGGIVIPWIFIGYGWARLDLQLQRVVNVFLPPPPFSGGNHDESVNVSIGGNSYYFFHAQEGNAQWTGIFDWPSKQFYPFTYNNFGLQKRAWQLTDNDNNGNNSVSIAYGYFYHITFHQIAAWTSQ